MLAAAVVVALAVVLAAAVVVALAVVLATAVVVAFAVVLAAAVVVAIVTVVTASRQLNAKPFFSAYSCAAVFLYPLITKPEDTPAKAQSPISVTVFGTVTALREAQSAKAPAPIDVTFSGITILLRAAHPENE